MAVLVLLSVASLVAGCGDPGQATDEDAQNARTTMTDLRIEELGAGTGAVAASGQTVTVHYTGWLFHPTNEGNKGRKFDSSVDRGEPFSFRLGAREVIVGWDEGVAGMKVGGKRRLTIPPGKAYGSRGAGSAIPPDSTLVFDVELLGVE